MDISNKFLAFLLVIAIGITIVGVGYSVNKLNKIGLITGFATTDTGFVNITLGVNVSITATTNTVNFGSGFLNPIYDWVVLTTEDGTTVPTNWSNTTVYDATPLVIENDGNVNLTLNFSSDKDADAFIGGDGPYFKYASANKEAGACGSGLIDAYVDVTGGATTQWICTNMGSSTGLDEVYVNISLKIPTGVSSGAKAATLSFTAAAA